MLVCAIIPARMNSTRLANKVLININNRTLIQHVYDNVTKSSLINEVFIATDHYSIEKVAKEFGAKVIMTSTECQSGTDRILEAIKQTKLNYDIVVNIQGDEPLITSELIDQAIRSLNEHPKCVVSTIASKKINNDDYVDPNQVKVILNHDNEAIYFSRSAIPYNRDSEELPSNVYLHIGLYAYRMDFLKKFDTLKKSTLESYEKLEQLRIIENNYRISVSLTHLKPIGVDVWADIEYVKERLKKG